MSQSQFSFGDRTYKFGLVLCASLCSQSADVQREDKTHRGKREWESKDKCEYN